VIFALTFLAGVWFGSLLILAMLALMHFNGETR